jgi:hypothetical protein
MCKRFSIFKHGTGTDACISVHSFVMTCITRSVLVRRILLLTGTCTGINVRMHIPGFVTII